MFIPCPHCGFLVALILPTVAAGPDAAAPRCPRCDGQLRVDSPETTGPIDSDSASGAGSDLPDAGSESRGASAEPMRTPSAPDRDNRRIDRRADPMDAIDAFDASDTLDASDASVASVASVELVASVVAIAADLPGASDPPIDTNASTSDRDARTPTAHDHGSTATAPTAPAARARRAPSFVRGNAPTRRSRLAWPWYAAIPMLALVLALQLLLAQRHELAASARWRPWVAGLCDVLPCTIPPWREPQAFTMLERSVRPSPAMPGVLAVQASFRNDARWPQPWPTLVLSLSDVEGRQVGVRAFAPSEYRGQAARAGGLLAPGQSDTVRLQVREPSPRIVAFTFDFQ